MLYFLVSCSCLRWNKDVAITESFFENPLNRNTLVTHTEGQGMQANENQWSQASYNQPTADDNFNIGANPFLEMKRAIEAKKPNKSSKPN